MNKSLSKIIHFIILLSIVITGMAQDLNNKKYQALISTSCDRVVGGGYMLSVYNRLEFGIDSVKVIAIEIKSSDSNAYEYLNGIYPYQINKDGCGTIDGYYYNIIKLDGDNLIVENAQISGKGPLFCRIEE